MVTRQQKLVVHSVRSLHFDLNDELDFDLVDYCFHSIGCYFHENFVDNYFHYHVVAVVVVVVVD